MPTYDYECKKCFHQMEKFQSIKDKPIKKCPKCGAFKMERLIGSGAGLIFKGSGFYITDYCRPKQNQSKELPKKDSSKTKTEKPKLNKNSTQKSRQGNKKD